MPAVTMETPASFISRAGLGIRDRIVHGAQHFSDALPVHRELLRAIEAGDPEAAAAAVESLLAQASEDLVAVQSQDQGGEHTDAAREETP
jgi:DNA-binding FadR family transcriptional regulator